MRSTGDSQPCPPPDHFEEPHEHAVLHRPRPRLPAGSKNKTATLVTGQNDALLVDAGFTRADGHRLAAAVLDSGKTLWG
jgi:hypothetical protein